jgi:hypothetical protein
VARPTRQCPRTLVVVYEPTDPEGTPRRRAAQEAQGPVDWDQWEKSSPRRYRFWIIWMVAMIVVLTIYYFSGNSSWFGS